VLNHTNEFKAVKGLGNTFELKIAWTLPLGILQWIFIEAPSQYQSWHLTLCCELGVQNHTQAFKSVKDMGNTFDLNAKWARSLPLGPLRGIFIDPPNRSCRLTPYCGLEMQNPTHTLKLVKDMVINFNLKQHNNFSVGNFMREIFRVPSPILKLLFDILLWVWGAESHQALKSVKIQGHSFELNSKWAKTLPLVILHGIFIEAPSQYRSWHLTHCCGLEVQDLKQALRSVKGLANTIDLNRKITAGCQISTSILRDGPYKYFL